MKALKHIEQETAYYHCVSEVLQERRLIDSEKEILRQTIRKVADFCGVDLLTYSLQDQRINIFIRIPKRPALSDQLIFTRVKSLYSADRASALSTSVHELRDEGRNTEADDLLKKYTDKMYNRSQFIKMFTERFTQGFNRRTKSRGTLWAVSNKTMLIEPSPEAISMMAAYIELSALRAGLVKDPALYPFCGYGEACAGNNTARQGIADICLILGHKGDWASINSVYRKQMLFDQEAPHSLSRNRIQKILDARGKLSRAQLLRCELRYLSDGIILGSREFVENNFEKNLEQFGPKRKSGARRPRHGDWGNLYTMRDLRLEAISPPKAAQPAT